MLQFSQHPQRGGSEAEEATGVVLKESKPFSLVCSGFEPVGAELEREGVREKGKPTALGSCSCLIQPLATETGGLDVSFTLLTGCLEFHRKLSFGVNYVIQRLLTEAVTKCQTVLAEPKPPSPGIREYPLQEMKGTCMWPEPLTQPIS